MVGVYRSLVIVLRLKYDFVIYLNTMTNYRKLDYCDPLFKEKCDSYAHYHKSKVPSYFPGC